MISFPDVFEHEYVILERVPGRHLCSKLFVVPKRKPVIFYEVNKKIKAVLFTPAKPVGRVWWVSHLFFLHSHSASGSGFL